MAHWSSKYAEAFSSVERSYAMDHATSFLAERFPDGKLPKGIDDAKEVWAAFLDYMRREGSTTLVQTFDKLGEEAVDSLLKEIAAKTAKRYRDRRNRVSSTCLIPGLAPSISECRALIGLEETMPRPSSDQEHVAEKS